MKLAADIMSCIFVVLMFSALIYGAVKAKPDEDMFTDSCQHNYPGDDNEE